MVVQVRSETIGPHDGSTQKLCEAASVSQTHVLARKGTNELCSVSKKIEMTPVLLVNRFWSVGWFYWVWMWKLGRLVPESSQDCDLGNRLIVSSVRTFEEAAVMVVSPHGGSWDLHICRSPACVWLLW